MSPFLQGSMAVLMVLCNNIPSRNALLKVDLYSLSLISFGVVPFSRCCMTFWFLIISCGVGTLSSKICVIKGWP